MVDNLKIKRKNIHTLINIGLIAFLILVATVGMRGLSFSSYGFEISGQLSSLTTPFTKDKIMVCAIGQCLFV